MIYIILGMHKSGTTLVSQILHESGVHMGNFDKRVGYDDGNKYEMRKGQEINIGMLGCRGVHSLRVIKPIEKEECNTSITKNIGNMVESLNSSCKDWGFKDPRTCLTYTVWKRNLPSHKIIFVYRHPLQVWMHYQRKVNRYNLLSKVKIGIQTLNAWYIYNAQSLNHISNTEMDVLQLDYNELLGKQEVFKKMEEFVGYRLVDCREKTMYRSTGKNDFLYNAVCLYCKRTGVGDVKELYKRLVAFRCGK